MSTTPTISPSLLPGEALPSWVGPLLGTVGIACWMAVGATPPSVAPVAVATSEPAPAVTRPSEATPASADVATPSPSPTPQTVTRSEAATSDAPVPCAPPLSFHFGAGARVPTIGSGDVERFVAWTVEHPDAALVVEGYASTDGSPAANLALSHERAVTVGGLLERAGVAHDQIAIQAFGEYRPTAFASTADVDRRAIVRVVDFPTCISETSQ